VTFVVATGGGEEALKQKAVAVVTPCKTSTIGTIGRYWIGALAGIPVAPVFGTRVTVIAVDEVLAAIAIIANIVGARDAVVALLVGQARRLLFADAVNTETGNTIPVAGVAFQVPRIGVAGTGAIVAEILGALVAVVALLIRSEDVRRAFTFLFAETAQTDTGNTIGLAGRVVVHPVLVKSTVDIRAMRHRGAYTIDALAVHAFVVVTVVTEAGSAAWRLKVASTTSGVAPVVCALVLVVAVFVALTCRCFTAPNQRNYAQRADT
jgi:hypothetical protein